MILSHRLSIFSQRILPRHKLTQAYLPWISRKVAKETSLEFAECVKSTPVVRKVKFFAARCITKESALLLPLQNDSLTALSHSSASKCARARTVAR